MPIKATLPQNPNVPSWLQPSGKPDAGTFDVSGGIEAAAKEGIGLLPALVSIYKDKAAREAAVQEFKDSVYTFAQKYMPTSWGDRPQLGNAWTDAAESLSEHFPRVAAAIRHG